MRCICAAPTPPTTFTSRKKAIRNSSASAYYAPSEDELKELAKAPGASGDREYRRARRRQARAAHGAERLPDRGGARHRAGGADSGQAPADEFRRSAAVARRRADAAAEGRGARQAHRPRRADDAEVHRDREMVPRRPRASSARTTSMSRSRTTSSARSTAATAATPLSTTTCSSASRTRRPG